MNYFERLVRRALLRPASAPGAALDDPFAAVAETPLEIPTSKRALETAPPPAIERATGGVGQVPVPPIQVPAPPPPAMEQAPAAVPQPVAVAPIEAPRPTAESVGKSVRAQRPGEASPREAPIAPQRDALALADAFMRSLGVQSQLPDLAPEPSPQPEAAKPNSAVMPEEKPASVARSPQVVPLRPPPPAPASRSAPASGAKEATPGQQPRREARTEATARTRTVVETRHVVVERKAAASDEGGGVSGGGAPRFGLGQL